MKKEQTQVIITQVWNLKPSSVEETPQSERCLHWADRLVTTVKISEARWMWRLLSHVNLLTETQTFALFCESFSTASSGTLRNPVSKKWAEFTNPLIWHEASGLELTSQNKSKQKTRIDTRKKDFTSSGRVTTDYSKIWEFKRNLLRGR